METISKQVTGTWLFYLSVCKRWLVHHGVHPNPSCFEAVKSHSNRKKHLEREKCAKSKSVGIFFKTASILSSTTLQTEESQTIAGSNCSTASVYLVLTKQKSHCGCRGLMGS